MRTFSVLMLAIWLAATTASAQKEQWLQYYTSREGRGFRPLELTTKAPEGVALPKFKADPYFAHWTTPLDPKGRWIAFDRSRRSGPYDLVYVDSKGDGRLDDKPASKAYQVDQLYAHFEPVRLVFKGEDGPITYHLGFEFLKYDGGSQRMVNLYLRSGGYYAGEVDLGGGKKKHVELLDANVNGSFNDALGDPGDCDCVVIPGESVRERYLGKLLEIGQDMYRVEVARDGAFIKIAKASDLSFGTVRVPPTIGEFVAVGPNGHFVRKPVKGEFQLPAGHYAIHEWNIQRKDRQGAAWELSGSGFPDSASFEVAEGKVLNLEIGEPVRAVVAQTRDAAGVSFDLSFKGRLGERIAIRKGLQNPPGPKLTLASQDGTYRVTNTFEFG